MQVLQTVMKLKPGHGLEWAHAKQSIFRLQHDLHITGDVISRQGGNAYPKVDVEAVLKFLGHALSQLLAGQSHVKFSLCGAHCALFNGFLKCALN